MTQPATLHLYVDSNVFLSFYSFTSDDIAELQKIVALINGSRLRLYVPEQTAMEVKKNRERKFLDALSQFERLQLPSGVPRFLMHFEEKASYELAAGQTKAYHTALLKRAREDVQNEAFPADALLRQLIQAAGPLVASASTKARAEWRARIGQPPGKDSGLGDRLIWETLLEHVPAGEDLHLLSLDKDFVSAIDKAKPHPLLRSEWQEAKKSDLHVYSSFASFLALHFTDIHLAPNAEQAIAIEDFLASSSYAGTHNTVRRLAPHVPLLTPDQRYEICVNALKNRQITDIGEDADVQSLILALAKGSAFDRLDEKERLAIRRHFSVDRSGIVERELANSLMDEDE